MSYNIPGPALSDLDRSLMIEEYGSAVEGQFRKTSFMRQYVKVQPVRGTDTITNNRMGKTTLKKLVPGVRPEADTTPFGKVSLTVDTVVLARNNQSMLNDFQTHIDVRSEVGKDHGRQIGYFFDEAFIIMAIKGSQASAPVLGDGDPTKQSVGAGRSITLTGATDHTDPDKLHAAISEIIVEMEEDEIPTEEIIVLVRPTEMSVLVNNDKLVSREYSTANGDFADGVVFEVNGARIDKNTRLPRTPEVNHFLSNAQNSNAYDTSVKDCKAVAVIMHPKGLWAGETIPLTSDVFFSREEKQWFIDSFLAFGVTVNRPDCCAAVFAADAAVLPTRKGL
jgi:hypothetical protein